MTAPAKAKIIPTVNRRSRSDTTLSMRIPVATRELIDSAAATLGKSRSEFIIECARVQAVDVLLDQRVFNLDAKAWQAFTRILDNPPVPGAALKKLMASKSPWT